MKEITAGQKKINRREFIKTMGWASAASFLPAVFNNCKSSEKLNIVLIVVDDLGWTDTGCCGSKYYETPNIDKLRASGMMFTQAYAACAVCSPTRASIMTGRYPARLGITDWIHPFHRLAKKAIAEKKHPQGYELLKGKKLKTPINKMWLDKEEIIIPEVLKEKGFSSCHVGKWHLGFADWYPDRQGFDFNRGGCEYGQPPDYFDPYKGSRWKSIPTLKPRKTGEYLTDREGDEAVRFIRRHGDEPFFLYMAHYAVHTPIQCKEEIRKKYAAKAKTNHTSPSYAAMIESVDQAVGKIMNTLEELKIKNNTLVIFTSDNGGASHVLVDGGKATDNSPLRAGKGYPYEGGIRVPLVVSWPGRIKPGSTCDVPVSSIDIFPTLCEAAGTGLPADRVIDGLSLMPLLCRSETLQRDTLYWHFPHYWGGNRVKPYSIIREGDWKLIRHYEDNKFELFNLKEDLGEQNDLAESMPKKVIDLKRKLRRWFKEVGALLPWQKKN